MKGMRDIVLLYMRFVHRVGYKVEYGGIIQERKNIHKDKKNILDKMGQLLTYM